MMNRYGGYVLRIGDFHGSITARENVKTRGTQICVPRGRPPARHPKHERHALPVEHANSYLHILCHASKNHEKIYACRRARHLGPVLLARRRETIESE